MKNNWEEFRKEINDRKSPDRNFLEKLFDKVNYLIRYSYTLELIGKCWIGFTIFGFPLYMFFDIYFYNGEIGTLSTVLAFIWIIPLLLALFLGVPLLITFNIYDYLKEKGVPMEGALLIAICATIGIVFLFFLVFIQ